MSIIFPRNHLSLTTESDIQTICKPLFEKTEITLFNYGRLFDDGYYYMLSSNKNLVHYVFGGENRIVVPPAPLLQNKFHYLIPPNGKYSREMHETRSFFNLENWVSFYEYSLGYIEVFCFASSPNNNEIINFYFNNLDCLENFISYFKEKISSLHKSLYKQRILAPGQQLLNFKPQTRNLDSTSAALNKPAQNYNITLKNRAIAITKREMDCLQKLTLGYSAKEIALSLALSHRTVEDHLQNAKAKLGCSKRSEVIRILLNQKAEFRDTMV